MSKLLTLRTFADERGFLTVLEREIPFDVKRLYYIYGVQQPTAVRGAHRHLTSHEAMICLAGRCRLTVDDQTYELDRPEKCVVVFPGEWHEITEFTADAVLLSLASDLYNPDDYCYDRVRES